jgi:uncharacterized protein
MSNSLSMYDLSVPVFLKRLASLDACLVKAAAYGAERKIDDATLLNARLFPDMLPMWRQVTIACDFAKGACARLAGVDVPKHADEEKTIADLRARIAWTQDFLKTLKPEQFAGSDVRDITMPIGGKPMTFKGGEFLTDVSMPNFYFHITTAYALLRHNGLSIGKNDFLGR